MDIVGVIDSGIGGISTLSALLNVLPNENFVYIADKKNSPYGDKSEQFVMERIDALCNFLKGEGAKAIVLACNTATTCCIEKLRQKNDIIYVGVEPPIKPACEELTHGKALILLTPLTASQSKFTTLKSIYGEKAIISVQKTLAQDIEKNLHTLENLKPIVRQIYQSYSHQNIESIALGCTHYCLIKNYFAQTFSAKIYEPNVGASIRLYNLLKQNNAINRTGGGVRFITL